MKTTRATTVLLADDHAIVLEGLVSLLNAHDFDVVGAVGDGAKLIEAAGRLKPDVIVTDLSMPGMSGWQVAERLRVTAGLEHTRVVIVSANAHEFSPGGPDTAHDAFLIKPIDMNRMLECLGTQLNLQWVRAAGEHNAAGENTAAGSELPGHARHHVDDLYQLGLIGHVRGIQAKLREMENEPGNRPFTSRMRSLVANFDLKGYMHVLEGMRKHG